MLPVEYNRPEPEGNPAEYKGRSRMLDYFKMMTWQLDLCVRVS